VYNDASAASCGSQGLGVVEGHSDMLSSLRQSGGRATRLRQHGPAGGGESGYRGGAEAAIGTEDEGDSIGHRVLLVGIWGDVDSLTLHCDNSFENC
jgi:hypothetical protein